MPTVRAPSPPPTAWPAYYPPSLRYLSDPRPHPDPSKLPPSRRYRPQGSGDKVRTMQDELDQLDVDEDELYNQVRRRRPFSAFDGQLTSPSLRSRLAENGHSTVWLLLVDPSRPPKHPRRRYRSALPPLPCPRRIALTFLLDIPVAIRFIPSRLAPRRPPQPRRRL